MIIPCGSQEAFHSWGISKADCLAVRRRNDLGAKSLPRQIRRFGSKKLDAPRHVRARAGGRAQYVSSARRESESARGPGVNDAVARNRADSVAVGSESH